jgi:hypothetical protein
MRSKLFALLALLALSCKAERAVSPSTYSSATATAATRAAAPQAPSLPHLIIRTADVSLIVGDTTASVEKLAALAAANGGYIADSKLWRDGEQTRATLTIRVPAQKLDAALAAIRRVATRVESETVSGDDVTQEYVDLESQVRNLEAAEVEMRALMTTVRERTKKAQDILDIYQQLTQLRGQIETAKGRMRYLSQMSAMSTIKLTLIPDAIAKPVVEPGWQPVAVMKDASRALLKTLQAASDVAIWGVIYVGPFLGVAFLVWRVARKLRKCRNAPSCSPAAG